MTRQWIIARNMVERREQKILLLDFNRLIIPGDQTKY